VIEKHREAGFILIVVTRDMDEFESFTRLLLFDRATIQRFTTNVVMGRDQVDDVMPVQADKPATIALCFGTEASAGALRPPEKSRLDASRA
jgi:hypothetical protein